MRLITLNVLNIKTHVHLVQITSTRVKLVYINLSPTVTICMHMFNELKHVTATHKSCKHKLNTLKQVCTLTLLDMREHQRTKAQ